MSRVSEFDVVAGVRAVRDEVVDTRRTLHRQPELSLMERKTAALVAERCRALGLQVQTGVGGHGVLADLVTGVSGPTVMVRADMDALPIQERGANRPCISDVDGAMHACGHDGHVAIGLGVASVLTTHRESLRGTVRFCFQPAEEVAGGAMPMIADGALTGVDRILGIHLWSPLQVGRVAATAGPIFGSADEFSITIRGRGGHGGMPQLSVDPLIGTAQVLLALQPIVSRETSPFEPVVVTVGKISGGTAGNVIAEETHLLGTVRALSSSDRYRILRRIEEVAGLVAAAAQCEAIFDRGNGCPPVVSDPESVAIVERAARAAIGAEFVDRASPITVGDDVAYFLEKVPGCYYLVGAGFPDRENAPHHHPEFDIDEKCLPVGVHTLTQATVDALNVEPAATS